MSAETWMKLSLALNAYVMAVQADPEAVGDGRVDAEEAYCAALTAHENAARAEAVLAFARALPLYPVTGHLRQPEDYVSEFIEEQGWSLPAAERTKP